MFQVEIVAFFSLQHLSSDQEATEEKLVNVWVADSLQIWRGNSDLEN